MLNTISISPQKQKLIVYILLTIVTLAVFWQVNQYDFINLDDNLFVTENSHIKSGITLEGFRWALSTKQHHLWTPLLSLSFMLDYQLYGLNAGGYHLTNLILHILNALLLFWLFHRMTGAIWKSAFVSALFALHPLHVESVAWISERKDMLSGFFWMLTLCLYVYYTEKPAVKRYLIVLSVFVLALMSKPMVITLPFIMILLDYWPLNRFESQKGRLFLWQLKEKNPFFILSAAVIIVTLYAPVNPRVQYYSLYSRITTAPVSFMKYLEKTFWPNDMSVYYPFLNQVSLWQVVGTSFLILIISIAVILMIKRLPYLFVGWLWYSITILPVLGIITIGSHAIADRYHYIPSVGIAILLAWGMPSLIKREKTRKFFLFPAGLAFLIMLAILTWNQCSYWKNSIKLFHHVLKVTKNNCLAHNHLATALFKQGNFGKAIYHYNEAIRINPIYADAYYNRGIVYNTLGQKQRALNDFKEASRTAPKIPKFVSVYNNIGVIYTHLGQYKSAIDNYNEALRIDPNYADAYKNRAFVYLMQGDKISGCRDAQRACALGRCNTLEVAKNNGSCP